MSPFRCFLNSLVIVPISLVAAAQSHVPDGAAAARDARAVCAGLSR